VTRHSSTPPALSDRWSPIAPKRLVECPMSRGSELPRRALRSRLIHPRVRPESRVHYLQDLPCPRRMPTLAGIDADPVANAACDGWRPGRDISGSGNSEG
jgi:hypothetical protein